MIKKLIIFLIRSRLGLKKYELFRFRNQKSRDIYYFTGNKLKKFQISVSKDDILNSVSDNGRLVESDVSLNWILSLNPRVAIKPIDDSDLWNNEYLDIKRWIKRTEWLCNHSRNCL